MKTEHELHKERLEIEILENEKSASEYKMLYWKKMWNNVLIKR